jgi:hypothetical protein
MNVIPQNILFQSKFARNTWDSIGSSPTTVIRRSVIQSGACLVFRKNKPSISSWNAISGKKRHSINFYGGLYLMNTILHRYGIASILSLLIMTGLIACMSLLSCSSSTPTYSGAYYSSGSTAYTQTKYMPPSWAPAYADASTVRYYFLPDCDAYYDASSQQFWSLNSGAWTPSASVPSQCSDMDLNSAYTVLLNRNVSQPWTNDAFYRTNYPVHSYDSYSAIISANNLIPTLPVGYEAIPRGFDEDMNRVLFIERSTAQPGVYSYVITDVPIQSIAPYMSRESRSYYYGGGLPSR